MAETTDTASRNGSATVLQLRAFWPPLAFILLMAAMAAVPRVQVSPGLSATILLFAIGLLAWLSALAVRARRDGKMPEIAVAIRAPHYVQATVQISLFAVFGWYWREVYDHAVLILAQLVFAYAVEGLLSWTLRRTWVIGFGPFPIILSTNLFLWFRDDWFYLQFLMILLGFLAKALLTWERDGRRTHIFNPSAFSLFVVSLVLIATASTDITWAESLATELIRPDRIYLVIFVLGLVVQALFSVTLVTLSAVAVLGLLNLVYTGMTGVYYFFDSNIPIAVFLGLHLLVTDPATSPRTDLGRIFFGALYGLGVFVLYALLGMIDAPTFYDKLLCVPLLNLSVRALDRIAVSLSMKTAWARVPQLGSGRRNMIHMAIWVVLFAGMYTTSFVGNEHAGRQPAFWQSACEQGLRNGCRNLTKLHTVSCLQGSAPACMELGAMARVGRALPYDPRRAERAFGQACVLGDISGCVNAGNVAAAAELLDRGCEADDAEDCFRLGVARASGTGGVVDRAAALPLYVKACELGWAEGCRGAGLATLLGDGIVMDRQRAGGWFEKGCAGDDGPSCANLAQMLRRGDGLTRDDGRAAETMLKACRLGTMEACRLLMPATP